MCENGEQNTRDRRENVINISTSRVNGEAAERREFASGLILSNRILETDISNIDSNTDTDFVENYHGRKGVSTANKNVRLKKTGVQPRASDS